MIKALIVIVVTAIVCLVLFVTGIFSPRNSRKMQEGVGRFVRRGEQKGQDNAGKLGDVTQEGLQRMREATEVSGEAGRRVHDKLTGEEP